LVRAVGAFSFLSSFPSSSTPGEILAFKIRGQWRIKRTELDQWLDAQPRGRGR